MTLEFPALLRPSAMDATRQDACDTKYNFKARLLNKKVNK